jgi:hypothetical protein
MSKASLARLARRGLVLAGTLAVIGLAAGTVQVASEWRAAEAPLDTAPVSMSTIEADFAIEEERAADIAARMDGVAGQVSSLQAALISAGGSVDTDVQAAVDLQARLDAATAKLTGMQKQLKAAQRRLEALNRAAERQAALNRNASSASSGSSSAREREDDDHDEEDHEEEDDD